MKNNLTAFICVALVPWLFLILYNALHLDTRGGFFEEYEVAIKVGLLQVAFVGCILYVFNAGRMKYYTGIKNMSAFVFFVLFGLFTEFSTWFIFAFRHGVGF